MEKMGGGSYLISIFFFFFLFFLAPFKNIKDFGALIPNITNHMMSSSSRNKKKTKEKRKNSSNQNRGMRRGITQPVPPLCFLSRFIIGRDGGGEFHKQFISFFFFSFFFGVCSTRQVSGESIMSPATLFALHLLLLLLAPRISPVPFSSFLLHFFHVQPKYLRGYFTNTHTHTKIKNKKKTNTKETRNTITRCFWIV